MFQSHIFFSLTLLISLAVLSGPSRAEGNPPSPSEFAQAVDKNRTALAVGLLNAVRKIQSRVEQFRVAGLPIGTQVDFSISLLNESPTITLGISADTASLPASESPLPCEHLLNLMRYLLADGPSTHYAQKIKDEPLRLREIDNSVSRAACDMLMLDIESAALDRDSFNTMSTAEAKGNVCADEVVLEAIIGPDDKVARCMAPISPRH